MNERKNKSNIIKPDRINKKRRLIWEVEEHDKYKRSLRSESEDGLTKFEITIEYRLTNDNFKLSDSSIFIRNKTLPSGRYYISSFEHKEGISNLRDLLMNKYCKGFKPSL